MQPDKVTIEQNKMPRWMRLLDEIGISDQVERTYPLPKTAVQPTVTSLKPSLKAEFIKEGLALLTEPEQVIELRILGVNGKRRTDSGYFNDLGKLARLAVGYEGRAEGLYFTLNPVNPALMARASNRIKEYAEHTTADHDIVQRITLPLDFDPARPAGISSTATEQYAALYRAWACRFWLSAQGWPEPVFASSGNGAHLLYAIDMPNDATNAACIKRVLTALGTLFSDDAVKVDTSTGNASRIFKLYGTTAWKGDNTAERPHRQAAILAQPSVRQLVTLAQLTVLADRAPREQKTTSRDNNSTAYGQAALDREIAALLAAGEGNRNNQLFRSSAALFGLVAGGKLRHADVDHALMEAARTIGLAESEARHTMDSGEKHGQQSPRLIPKPQPARLTRQPKSEEATVAPDVSSGNSEQPLPVVIQPTVKTPTSAVTPLMHVDQLDSLPPIRWLIQDVLPANALVEMHGAPGSGKTQVMFDMAQTLAALGQPVIYVVAEGLQGYRGRKKAWQQFRKQPGGELYIWGQAVHLFEPDAVRAFVQAIQPKKPALVVFDTLSRCSLGADENNQKDMNFILEGLDRVRRETGAAVVAVHHTNASGQRERGSTVIRGGMDAMLEVAKEDDLIIVSCSKMKDAGDFTALYFKPVLVDIGEENPVPVLVPAEKRTQTQADKLTTLQLDILRAIGLEMFAESGIKSNQLDELLPPSTKRTSKYYGLNTVIRLGYVKPHIKGDPYYITEEGRLKLSNAGNGCIATKSRESNASPNTSIWTLPEPSPKSSPPPQPCKGGVDQTWDKTAIYEQTSPTAPDTERSRAASIPAQATISSPPPLADAWVGDTMNTDLEVASVKGSPVPLVRDGLSPTPDPMPPSELAEYAALAGVTYPTVSGPDLYRMATGVPKARREAFEEALGDSITAYYEELVRQGHEPTEPISADVLGQYLLPGLVTTLELYNAYHTAWDAGQGRAFWEALRARSSQATDMLNAWLTGNKTHKTVFIDGATNFGHGTGASSD